MANRFFNPNEQFADTTGLPYAGGSLAFFASGTSTPLNTYSDSALSIPNTNPVVLDSAGRAGTVFLQNLAYKVVLSDVNNNQIWTEDPVYTSDYSTRATFLSGAGSPNGVVAGTAGSAGIGASVYWDNVNNILYVCTQTGTTSTAVWTAVNSTAAAAITPQPQGYLTLTSGTPIILSDVATNAVLYTPYLGNLVSVYNGTSFTPTVFSELTLPLTTSQAASTLYDVFVFNNSGVLTLVTGPAWSSSTAGSCTRGTGAGTTQLSRLSGLWVNTVLMTGRNSTNTYSIPANQATYLGSIFIDTTPGQITCHRLYGQSRKWGVWNAYNRVPVYLKAGDSTASWTVGSTTRAANANAANSLTVFQGLAEEVMQFTAYERQNGTQVSSGSLTGLVGIGFNSTTTVSGQSTSTALSIIANWNETLTSQASFYSPPSLGINVITLLEGSGGGLTAVGGEANNAVTAWWRA